MSIFDSIIDNVSSLFDDNSDVISGGDGESDNTLGGSGDSSNSGSSTSGIGDVGKALGLASRGYQALQTAAATRLANEYSLEGDAMKNASLASTKNSFKPDTNQKYGEPNYSANYESIKSQWMSYLQGVAGDSKVVPGERYTHGGVD